MSRIFVLTLIAGILIGSSSCKQEGLSTYNTTNSIYFNNVLESTFYDTSYIGFGYVDPAKTDSIIQVIVSATGSPSENDRPFKIVADPSSTAVAGKHYEAFPETMLLPAHQVSDTFTIKLLRSEDLKTNEVTLLLDLQPNASFTTNLKDAGPDNNQRDMSFLQYRITFSDIVVQPLGWSDGFGKFSPKKMYLICQLGGISPSWLNTGDVDYPLFSKQYNVKCSYMAGLLNNYLTQMTNAGTPVYYEDGVTPMATDDGN